MRELTLLDWKTSKGAMCYDEYRWQASAYVEAANAMGCFPERINHAIICAFDKETGRFMTYYLTDDDISNGIRIFRACRELYDAMGLVPARYYESEDNPSVTTVLDILSKPPLIQWAANSVNDFWQEHLEEVRNPQTTDLRIEQIIKSGKTAHRRKSKEAMSIGTLVHEAIELHLAEKAPDEILRGNEKAQTAYLAFLYWLDTVKLEVVALEKQLIHPTLHYGGTADCIGWINI